MLLTSVEYSLLVGAYFRGGWTSNSDQIVTVSLFYTGDVSFAECEERFSQGCVGGLYCDDFIELRPEIRERYAVLLKLLQKHPELISGAGDLVTPADPTYTSCQLTAEGERVAELHIGRLPRKPDFPHWPDRREFPSSE